MRQFLVENLMLEKADVVICFISNQPFIYKNDISGVLGKTKIKNIESFLKICAKHLTASQKEKA